MMIRLVPPKCCPPLSILTFNKRFGHSTNLYPTYLAEDVDKTGKAGDIVLLRAGFARNYIYGTGKGVMIPRDQRAFVRHRQVYELLGYPVEKIDQYYAGESIAKSKGQKTDSPLSAVPLSTSSPTDSLADQITTRLRINQAIESSLTSTPLILSISSAIDGSLNLGTKDVMEAIIDRQIPDVGYVLKHQNQIAFYVVPDGTQTVSNRRLLKTRVLNRPGKFLTTLFIPLVGYLRFYVSINSAPASIDSNQLD